MDLKHGLDLHRQAKELNKAFGILLIIDIFFAKGSVIFPVKTIGGAAAHQDDIALVEFQANRPGQVPLSHIDEGIERLAKRGKPLAVVDQFGIFVSHNLFIMEGLFIQAELLQGLMRLM